MAFSQPAIQSIIITGIFSALGAFFIALRLWTRLVIIRATGYEDIALVASWVSVNPKALRISTKADHYSYALWE